MLIIVSLHLCLDHKLAIVKQLNFILILSSSFFCLLVGSDTFLNTERRLPEIGIIKHRNGFS